MTISQNIIAKPAIVRSQKFGSFAKVFHQQIFKTLGGIAKQGIKLLYQQQISSKDHQWTN